MVTRTAFRPRKCALAWAIASSTIVGCSPIPNDCGISRSCSSSVLRGGAAGISGFAGATTAGLSGVAGAGNTGGLAGATSVAGASGDTFTPEAGAAGTADTAGAAGAAGTGELAGAAGTVSATGTITITTSPIARIRLGTKSNVDFSLQRTGTVAGVTVSAEGLPSGIVADVATVQSDAIAGTVGLVTSDPSLAGGPYAFTIKATTTDNPNVVSQIAATLYVAQASGTLDSSFGANGVLSMRASARDSDSPKDVAVDASGRMIVAGCGNSTSLGDLGWVARLSNSGVPDTSFATTGTMSNISLLPSCVYRVLEKDLSTLIWFVSSISGTTASYIRKLTEAGKIDLTFGAAGIGDILLSNADVPQDLIAFGTGSLALAAPNNRLTAITDSGITMSSFAAPVDLSAQKIAQDFAGRLVYGKVSTAGFIIGRLTLTGQRDLTFGSSGEALTSPFPSGGTSGRVVSVMPAPNGSIYALVETAKTATSTSNTVSVLAYAADGTINSNYKLLFTDTGTAYDAMVDPKGRVFVLYGETNTTTSQTTLRLSCTDPAGLSVADFATSSVLDLTSALPNFAAQGLTFEPYGNRLVVFGSASTSVGLVRVWL